MHNFLLAQQLISTERFPGCGVPGSGASRAAVPAVPPLAPAGARPLPGSAGIRRERERPRSAGTARLSPGERHLSFSPSERSIAVRTTKHTAAFVQNVRTSAFSQVTHPGKQGEHRTAETAGEDGVRQQKTLSGYHNHRFIYAEKDL